VTQGDINMSDEIQDNQNNQQIIENQNAESSESESSEGQSVEAAGAESVKAQEAAIDANKSLTKQEKAEAKRNIKKLQLKVDGKVYDEEIDLDDEKELVRRLQLAKAAQSRIKQYSDLQRDVEQFVNELRSNPRKLLADPDLGIDLKKLAAEVLEEEIENSKKSPEQLAKEKLEAELKALKDEREREKKETQQRELERLRQQEFERYDMLVDKALSGSDLPKSPFTVKKMAEYMLMGVEAGIDVTPEDVIPLIRQDLHDDLQQMFAAMPEEVIEKLVGKETINKIRKKNLAKSKTQAKPPVPVQAAVKDTGAKSSDDSSQSSKDTKKSYRDFFGV